MTTCLNSVNSFTVSLSILFCSVQSSVECSCHSNEFSSLGFLMKRHSSCCCCSRQCNDSHNNCNSQSNHLTCSFYCSSSKLLTRIITGESCPGLDPFTGIQIVALALRIYKLSKVMFRNILELTQYGGYSVH